MRTTAKVLRYGALTLMALFGLVGGLFVIGEAFDDPGGWPAVGMTAAWVVPLLALGVLAVRSPSAGAVFVAVTGLAVLFTVADSTFGILPRDTGPVGAIVVFALGVALAFLALHRATLAGLLMVVAGVAQVLSTQGHLGGSSGAAAVPVVVAGLLFLLAGTLGHEPLRSGRTPGDADPQQRSAPRRHRLLHSH